MVDYSKWKNIEISDDEDDTHPNIDKHSLFKWRHEARLQRMKEFEDKKNNLFKSISETKSKLDKLKNANTPDKEEIKELESKLSSLAEEEESLKKQERLMPWNVDTISSEGWSKTVVNKPPAKIDRSKMTEEEQEQHYAKFVKENEKKLKHYAMLAKWDDCRAYLLEEPQLVCEETANYLTVWCLNLEIESKHDLMQHISKQVLAMQYILEISKQIDCDPRSCINSFFTRIQTTEKQYVDAFEEELSEFRKRIVNRAKEKIEKAIAEVEEEERQKRLGPGGLDPGEVFETLPENMKECFEKKDIEKLKQVISQMDKDEATYHMKRCVDSGLWVPDAKALERQEAVDEKSS